MSAGALLRVPAAFAAATQAREGDAGRRWLQALPELVATLLERWALTLDAVHGEARHGYVALVLPVRTAGHEPAVLKVTWRDPESEHEALALAAWDGGAVRLLEADSEAGALVLERLDPARDLHALPHEPATAVAGRLLADLRRPAPGPVPALSARAAGWARELPQRWARLGQPLPHRHLDAAVAVCRELGPEDRRLLLHGDLHYANVLAGSRQPWLAIDPKPLAGDPAFEMVPLLRSRWPELAASGDLPRAVRRRLAVAADAAQVDRDRARRWALARAVDDGLWFLEHRQRGAAGISLAIADALAAGPAR